MKNARPVVAWARRSCKSALAPTAPPPAGASQKSPRIRFTGSEKHYARMARLGYSKVSSRRVESGNDGAARAVPLLLCLVMVEISCRGLLFDLDGVLVDSTPAVARVWTKWAIGHGFDPEETVRNAHGRPSLSTVKELLPNAVDPVLENEVIVRG